MVLAIGVHLSMGEVHAPDFVVAESRPLLCPKGIARYGSLQRAEKQRGSRRLLSRWWQQRVDRHHPATPSWTDMLDTTGRQFVAPEISRHDGQPCPCDGQGQHPGQRTDANAVIRGHHFDVAYVIVESP